jgi:hypothetical protein
MENANIDVEMSRYYGNVYSSGMLTEWSIG